MDNYNQQAPGEWEYMRRPQKQEKQGFWDNPYPWLNLGLAGLLRGKHPLQTGNLLMSSLLGLNGQQQQPYDMYRRRRMQQPMAQPQVQAPVQMQTPQPPQVGGY